MKHSVWVVSAPPVGMLPMFSAFCTCSWEGQPTPEKEEAEEDARKHRRETYVPTIDDLAWMAGTGRWAQ